MEPDKNPPRHISKILGEIKLIPDCEAPEIRKQQCAQCHTEFLSRPQWFGTKWQYPNICIHCGDAWSHRSALRSGSKRTILINNPGVKKFHCPGCYRVVPVAAKKDGLYWAYIGDCPDCGVHWENLYYAYKAPPKKDQPSERKDRNADPD